MTISKTPWETLAVITLMVIVTLSTASSPVSAQRRGRDHPVPFRRGDTDGDGEVNLTDAVFLFGSLFGGGRRTKCLDAADTNSDGSVNLSDGIYGLSWLFRGGPRPPFPGPHDCGTAPELGCRSYPVCRIDGEDADDVGQWEIVGCRAGADCWERQHRMAHAIMTKADTVLTCGSGVTDGNGYTWDHEALLYSHVHAPVNLFCSGHVNLFNGEVLWAGGTIHEHDHGGPIHYEGATFCYTFNPDNDDWVQVSDMFENRWYPTLTTLNDGKVVATGGYSQANDPTVRNLKPEIYDPWFGGFVPPFLGSWTRFSNAELNVEGYPFMFLLPDPEDPRLFFAGCQDCEYETRTLGLTDDPNNKPTQVHWDEKVYDSTPVAGGSAAMYLPGVIMKAGGRDRENHTDKAVRGTVVIDMNSASPRWKRDADMNYARFDFNLVILPSGDVLAVGGSEDAAHDESDQDTGSDDAVFNAELWTPRTGDTAGAWSVMSAMTYPRKYHSVAVLLPDARVFVGGAFAPPEIFSPPYLFDGDVLAARPVIQSVSHAELDYGEPFSVSVVGESASTIASACLIRPGAATHGFDMEQRLVPLDYSLSCEGTAAGAPVCTLAATAPAHGYLAPPGYYMLFVVDSRGVPSEAAKVRLRSENEY